MNRRLLVLSTMLPLLAACSASTAMTEALIPQSVGFSESTSEKQSDVLHRFSGSFSDNLLYIGNTGNQSITVYRHEASGNAAPLYTIAGSRTGITSPGQLSEDAAGNLYVANASEVLVFAHGAKGNIAPIRILSGPQTGLNEITAMTVDRTSGKIFVADLPSSPDGGFARLVRFPPNAAGDVAPFARSSLAVPTAIQLASDSSGNNLIEAHTTVCCNAGSDGVDTIGKQFANGAIPLVAHSVREFYVSGVADDPTTKTYLVSSNLGIYRLAEATDGDGPSGRDGVVNLNLKPSAVSVISSDTCGGQMATAMGQSPYTYVVGVGLSPNCLEGVAIYESTASGNAQPVRILRGPATKMDRPFGIYEGL